MVTYASFILILGSGLFAGFLTGLVSLGGAFIVVPAVYHTLLELGATSHTAFTSAVATSLMFVLVSSVSASVQYARKSMIDFRLVVIVCSGALIGLMIGIEFLLETDDVIVRYAFGFFIWILGSYLLFAKYYKFGNSYSGEAPTYTVLNQAMILLIGGGVGFLVGVFGIGGGGIIAPAVALLTRSDMKRAIATGVGATVVISVIGVGGYVISGIENTDAVWPNLGWVYLPALLLLVPCALIAAPFGARVAMRLSQSTLLSILGASMFMMGVKFVFF